MKKERIGKQLMDSWGGLIIVFGCVPTDKPTGLPCVL